MNKRRVVYDSDFLSSSCRALGMLLSAPEQIEVVAVTVCCGSIQVDQAHRNARRVLREYERLDIPVFKGLNMNVLGKRFPNLTAFGKEGIGGAFDNDKEDQNFDFESDIPVEKAHDALLRMTRQNMEQLTLICTGPLSNVARALRVQDSICFCIKEIIVTGGYFQEMLPGNPGEINFSRDLKAAEMLFNSRIPFTVIPYDLFAKTPAPQGWYEKITKKKTKCSDFFKKIGEVEAQNVHKQHFAFYPEVAAAIAIDPNIILKTTICEANVTSTDRGQGIIKVMENAKGKVNIINKYNVGPVLAMMEKATD